MEVEWEAKELLQAFLPGGRDGAGAVGADLLEQIFDEYLAAHGERPTAGELFRMGYGIWSLKEKKSSWFTFLAAKGGLDATEQAVALRAKAWFKELETTALAKSYKMVTLEVLLEADALAQGMDIQLLAERALRYLLRSPDLLKDLKGVKEFPDPARIQPSQWLAYWLKNPIHHWTNKGASSWFRVEGGIFAPNLPVAIGHEEVLAAMTRELVDYRLARYRARIREPLEAELEFDAKVTWNQSYPILKIPAADTRPQGLIQVRLPAGEPWEFKLMAQFCNVAHPMGEGGNRLPELLQGWFGPDAGKPGTQFSVHFARGRDGWTLVPLGRPKAAPQAAEESTA